MDYSTRVHISIGFEYEYSLSDNVGGNFASAARFSHASLNDFI